MTVKVILIFLCYYFQVNVSTMYMFIKISKKIFNYIQFNDQI